MAIVNKIRRTFQFTAWLIALAVGSGGQAFAAVTDLSSAPLITQTSSSALPNVMFVLDDSGSMAWDYLPDNALDFTNNYGFESSQCNGLYFNPSLSYNPPIKADGSSYPDSSFTAAWTDGYAGTGSVNLNSQFKGGSGSGQSGASGYSGGVAAFYYNYLGADTYPPQQNYFTTSGPQTFYNECNSPIGSAPGVSEFTKVTLSTVPSSIINISGNTVTITVGGSGATTVSGIKVGGSSGTQILSGTTGSSASLSTVALFIATNINNCTIAVTGNCTVAGGTGYYATCPGYPNSCNPIPPSTTPVITLYGPGSGLAVAVTSSGGMTFTVTPSTGFAAVTPTIVTGITVGVGGTQLLSGTTSTTSPIPTSSSAMADAIVAKLSAAATSAGYTMTSIGSSSSISITGPAGAAGKTPLITACLQASPSTCYTNDTTGQTPAAESAAGGLDFSTAPFTSSSATDLQNFANWYSYYSNRMLMMKTAVGQAFSTIGNNYRIGFMTMNNNVSPGFVDILPFNSCTLGAGCQKDLFYTKLYASMANNSTPLREALSHVGQLYANKIGTIYTYTSTITLSGSGSTSVDGITVNAGTGSLNYPSNQLMQHSTPIDATTTQLAADIANQIDALIQTDYGATVSGNVVTVYGPASAAGATPVIADTGGMTETATAFAQHSTTATLNGVTPLDPMQYSCQQNFVILSTDGYWNGSTTYNLATTTGTVGNPDGTSAYTGVSRNWGPETRPMLDGSNTSNTLADVAEYYYQTDLRDNLLSNCTGSATSTVTAGSFVVGNTYSITTVGTTSFTSIGASANTVGIKFTATGAGSGTGTAGQVNDVCADNVPSASNSPDTATWQHMTTFTLGLGARGKMNFDSKYENDTCTTLTNTLLTNYYNLDYCAVKLGLTASSTASPPVCPWQSNGTTCNWPVPTNNSIPANIDDLWHAAINGRGAYFFATDPYTLATGLSTTLSGIRSRTAAASASATSSPNITPSDRSVFSSSFDPSSWTGELAARLIDPTNGAVSNTINWCADGIPPTLVNATALTAGTTYYIYSAGNTTWTTIGASANTTGTQFTATGAGTGTGTATTSPIACPTPYTQLLTLALTQGTTYPPVSGSRNVYTFTTTTSTTGNHLTSFVYGNLTATQQAYFSNLCTASPLLLTQCNAGMNALDRANTNSGAYLVQFLRGDQSWEFGSAVLPSSGLYNGSFRARTKLLGDAVDSMPLYVRLPIYNFSDTSTDTGYSAYVTIQAALNGGQGRQGMIYVGANDGILHAFYTNSFLPAGCIPPTTTITGNCTSADPSAGKEVWSYVPGIVMPNLYKLADITYGKNTITPHQYYVDGSPVTMDIYVSAAANNLTVGWHTILVGGLGLGGQGFYALDITDPNNPQALWEICSSSTLCAISDNDMGYSYGNPVIVKRSTDGKWVVLVTSGYNNVGGTHPGQAYLYELDAVTGAVLHKTSTGTGSVAPSATAPVGLAKISPLLDSPNTNMQTRFVYGGDLNGDVWRFDLGAPGTAETVTPTAAGPTSVTRIATLGGPACVAPCSPVLAAPVPQSVTTRPQLGDPENNVTNSLSTPTAPTGNPVVFVATGRYLGQTDVANTQIQSVYAIEDDLTLVSTSTPSGYYGNPRTYSGTRGTFVQQYIYQPSASAYSASATTRTTSTNSVSWATNSGWYADFAVDGSTNSPVSPSPSPGERVNLDPQLYNGALIVVTNVPPTNTAACGSLGLGSSWLYSFNFLNGEYIATSGNTNVATQLFGGLSGTAGYSIIGFYVGGSAVLATPTSGNPPTSITFPYISGSTHRTSWRELTQ